MIKKLSILFTLLLSACVYHLDIQQGNILTQKDIDKLRPDLTKNQVVFVLGTPVIDDGFADNKWIYLYDYKNKNNNLDITQKIELFFEDDKLVSASSDDFEVPDTLKK